MSYRDSTIWWLLTEITFYLLAIPLLAAIILLNALLFLPVRAARWAARKVP